ncbi:MAG: MBL fold metallo-hydrolase [Candidatus Omnitrophica bacterium]|nr:MBL fold metallo-hydrolase [Candidatus Omnitrophota bacterium]MBU4473597.1 MBL fold metallo-hydrolase [Candidatus Omnitrophota bacterium]MCG2706314.1 MBL fold metallo-hydrolase [Candidatus Omnitrophota bacterium]
MILETVCVGPMQVNCYILAVRADSEAVIIDPGDEENKIRYALGKYKLKPAFIINTHAHIDHIGADGKFDIPVYIHSKDLALSRNPELNLSHLLMLPYSLNSKIRTLEDKENIELDGIQLEVIHTPGHTPGGICLLMRKPCSKVLFTGDTLFCQGIGRTDFPGADEKLLIKSIKNKLLKLPDDTVIYPGHGPSSTIGGEKKSNTFFI